MVAVRSLRPASPRAAFRPATIAASLAALAVAFLTCLSLPANAMKIQTVKSPGVGLAAVELGKAKSARVIAAVSSEEKAAAAREAGADEAVVYPRGPFDREGQKALAELFKAAVGPNGADVIYDPVGGDYAEPALRAIAWEGRYLVVGFPAGIPKLPLNLALLKSCDVCGVFWGAFAARDPAANAAHVAELFRLWEAGNINPKVSATYSLERAGEAIAAMAARQAIGKLVVTI